jgi:sterol desaturase/sphingolipid hydroxylase (fatty acid hydroxylase superfamily)
MDSIAQTAAPGATAKPMPEYRQRHQRRIPIDYSVTAYFGTTNAAALAFMAGAAWQLYDVHPLEWLILPAAFVLLNFAEYWLHRGPLHIKKPSPDTVFNRHTRVHHDYFRHNDMALTRAQECVLVLFPYWAVGVVIVAALVPYALLLIVSANLAHLFLVAAIGYYLLYEWLHLLYHLPERYWIARLGVVRTLRRHHRVHHHRKLMQRYNYNVTLPIFDWVLQTSYRRSRDAEAGEAADNRLSG